MPEAKHDDFTLKLNALGKAAYLEHDHVQTEDIGGGCSFRTSVHFRCHVVRGPNLLLGEQNDAKSWV